MMDKLEMRQDDSSHEDNLDDAESRDHPTVSVGDDSKPASVVQNGEDRDTNDREGQYHEHKSLDLDKPLLPQWWNAGSSRHYYLEQVHRPRFYRGGPGPPLVNFLEPLGGIPWWSMPLASIPLLLYGTYICNQGLPSALQSAELWLFGVHLWSLIEYALFRGFFELEKYTHD